MKKHIIAAPFAFVLLSAPTLAADHVPTPATAQAPIMFNELGGVRSWKSGGDTTVFVQSSAGQWYKAELRETCMKYDTSKGVRFITELDPMTNEKVSAVMVERRICRVTSLAKVDGPDAAKQ